MTSSLKRQLIETLTEVWELSEDVRLGQLMALLGFLGESHLERGLWDIEDDELLAILYRHRAELLARAYPDQFVSPPAPGPFVSLSGSEFTPPSPSADATS